ncbi:MAG: metal ABC transporter ATP-binding protein [Epsilonproteobacteria bacterium]|nr:MAG: metal ABC transporter ATP-binding protein [Campylobacterota bacterium]RLA67277.1 MAG: metal ABC transporter ATP-binding protein [Campylobacterota bacterium]
MQSQILEAKKVCFYYPDAPDNLILKDISFYVSEGQALGILGPNGGGKTTLLKILVGLMAPSNGTLELKGKSVKNLKELHGPKIGYVPQLAALNTILPVRIKDFVSFGKINSVQKEQVTNVLELVGLQGKEDKQFSELSGGEKKRAQLAKALVSGPFLLVLDEPTAGLDSIGQDQLLELLAKLRADFNTAVIIVDHNINQIIKHCDKILCLNKTSHWHEDKDYLTKSVLESIYHCEFEHLLLHEKESVDMDKKLHHHHFCDKDHDEEDH